MSDTLELPRQSIGVFDKSIQKALTNEGKQGVMTYGNFELLLRNSPETSSVWANTKKAKEEAASYANSILQSFGLMA
jgi:hypothetical protein